MNRVTLFVASLALAAGIAGCKPKLHLQYDFGRAYVETLRLQADLTRPSVANASYDLYGPEGVQIRVNVQADSTEVNTGEYEIEAKQ